MFLVRNRTWLIMLLASFVLSVGAVAAHPLPYSYVPHGMSLFLESFASPGEFLWWATLGGAFAGYPSGWTGYAVWVLGNTAFWFLASAICVAAGKGIHSTVQRFRRLLGVRVK